MLFILRDVLQSNVSIHPFSNLFKTADDGTKTILQINKSNYNTESGQ